MKSALISRPPVDRRATAIERSLYAMARAAAHTRPQEREEVARLVYANDDLVQQIVERGAAPLGTTTASNFGTDLARPLVGEYIETLAPLSAAAALIGMGMQVNLAAATSMTMPARTGAPSTTVSWVGEGEPIPVRTFVVNDDTVLQPRKFGFIVAISRELARRAGGDAVVRQLIREDAASTLDAAYFSTASGDATTHPGMLDGLTAKTGFGGGDLEAFEADMLALSDAVSEAGSGQVVFITSPRRANRIKIRFPKHAPLLAVLPSLAVADDRIIAVDPASWAHGFGADFDLDVSEAATLHMSDDPNPIVATTTADPVRSVFQTASLALRMLADVAFASRRPNAVAFLNNPTW